MTTIRALANPRNIFNSLLSRQWHQVLQGDVTFLYDGDRLVLEVTEFPDRSEREIALPDGTRFRRSAPREAFTCVAGAYLGRRFDEVLVDLEQCGQEADALFGCLQVNVVAFDAKLVTFTS